MNSGSHFHGKNQLRYQIRLEGCWGPDQVCVQANETTTHVWPSEIWQGAKDHWKNLTAQNPTLFNGQLATLQSFKCTGNHLFLNLGSTTYQQLMFSNANANLWREQHKHKWLVKALGISAIVETNDRNILLIKRSAQVGEYPLMLDVVGGHIEPTLHVRGGNSPDIFLAISDEIQAELGISPEKIHQNVLIGSAENIETAKPEIVFWTLLDCSAEQVRQKAQHAPEAVEFTEIATVETAAGPLAKFLQTRALECTPSAEASLEIFRRFRVRVAFDIRKGNLLL